MGNTQIAQRKQVQHICQHPKALELSDLEDYFHSRCFKNVHLMFADAQKLFNTK